MSEYVPDIIVDLGMNVTLECLVEGNPEPDIFWARGETLVRSKSLDMINITHEDIGNYTCIVPDLKQREFHIIQTG